MAYAKWLHSLTKNVPKFNSTLPEFCAPNHVGLLKSPVVFAFVCFVLFWFVFVLVLTDSRNQSTNHSLHASHGSHKTAHKQRERKRVNESMSLLHAKDCAVCGQERLKICTSHTVVWKVNYPSMEWKREKIAKGHWITSEIFIH